MLVKMGSSSPSSGENTKYLKPPPSKYTFQRHMDPKFLPGNPTVGIETWVGCPKKGDWAPYIPILVMGLRSPTLGRVGLDS